MMLTLETEEKIKFAQQIMKRLEPKLRGIFQDSENDASITISNMSYFGPSP